MSTREDMHIVIVGHVDHGKSTVIGRLLADTHSLPEGKLQAIQEMCRRNAKPFEYAFLLDALKDEQAQGITIDSARSFFKTKKRDYIIIDAPGHIEFLKNMITGASRASAALLVIDANEGVMENSKRHGYMLSMLGIKSVAVLVNKMDLVNYDEQVFNNIKKEYNIFLQKIGIKAKAYIPISAFKGDNIVNTSSNMPWYNDLHVLSLLDNFESEKDSNQLPFRMAVQDVYKFTSNNDNRRIVAGTIASGILKVNDEVIFYPSGKKSKVKSIEAFNSPIKTIAKSDEAIGFTLEKQIFIKRGEIACKKGQVSVKTATTFKCSIFWLSNNFLEEGSRFIIKIGSEKVQAKLKQINETIDSSNLDVINKKQIKKHEVSKCIIECEKAIAFDTNDIALKTSRFVIVDNYEISGGGIILEEVKDKESQRRENILNRNINWVGSHILSEERSSHYGHKSALIIIEGDKHSSKKELAMQIERYLFELNLHTYYIGMGSIKYGMDSDLLDKTNEKEHIRRYVEMLNILLKTGLIVITTISKLSEVSIKYITDVLNEYEVHIYTCNKEKKELKKKIINKLKEREII